MVAVCAFSPVKNLAASVKLIYKSLVTWGGGGGKSVLMINDFPKHEWKAESARKSWAKHEAATTFKDNKKRQSTL